MCLFRFMCRVAMLGPLCLVVAAGDSFAANDKDVRVNLHLPLVVECAVEPNDTRVANVAAPGVYVCDQPMVLHVTTNSLIGEFDLDYESSHGNLNRNGTEIRSWYIFRPSAAEPPTVDDPWWKTGQELQEAAPLMYVMGNTDFELWCKVEVQHQAPGFYANRWQITLNMLVTTCRQEAMFSCYISKRGEIPDEYEIKQDGDVVGGGR